MHLQQQLANKQKQFKKEFLNSIYKVLYDARVSNNSQILHKMVHTIVQNSKKDYPQVTRDAINRSFKKYLVDTQFEIITESNTNSIINNLQENNRQEVTLILIENLLQTNISLTNQNKGRYLK